MFWSNIMVYVEKKIGGFSLLKVYPFDYGGDG